VDRNNPNWFEYEEFSVEYPVFFHGTVEALKMHVFSLGTPNFLDSHEKIEEDFNASKNASFAFCMPKL